MPDVVIAGGGPAGSTLARRLARLGHAVTLFERSSFDGPTDGESYHANVPPLPSLIRWQSSEVVSRPVRQVAVLRPAFDAMLLELAEREGATVIRRAAEPANAAITVDATGRASWSRGMRTRTGEPAIAMRALWRGGELPREMRVEALEDGWLWGAPMPDGSFAAIACVDAPTEFFELLARSLLFRDLPRDAAVHAHDATAYAADVFCDEQIIRIGDASHSLDPLSSSGIRSAMQSATHASIVINTIVRRPDDAGLARRFYTITQRAAVAEHQRWTRAFYAEGRFRDAPFWRKRAAAAPAAVESPEHVALAEGIEITDVPCVIGDFIESRRGIAGASIRPFTRIGTLDAARLLEPLAGRALASAELLEAWRAIAPHRETALLESLVRSGVIVRSTPPPAALPRS